jgi:Fe-Mn family superoxide dismutase
MENDRRDFLKKSALLGLAGIAGGLFGEEKLNAAEKISTLVSEDFPGGSGKITLPPLPYEYDALEPVIDKETMKIHHTKHHQAYIDKLNTAGKKEFDPAANLAESCAKVNEQTSALVRNNLGGHYNHTLFWQWMKAPSGKDNMPSGPVADAITKHFKSFDKFKAEFSDKALKQFGSGWAWLVKAEDEKLKITSTPNQDNPLMQVAAEKGIPILGLDVWEHAYYLKYQNKRADYAEAWWKVVNWEKVNELFSAK